MSETLIVDSRGRGSYFMARKLKFEHKGPTKISELFLITSYNEGTTACVYIFQCKSGSFSADGKISQLKEKKKIESSLD